MRILAAVVGVAFALGLCVWGGLLTYDAIDSLADGARRGETRTPIPGATDVELDEGKYVVFYEVDASSVASADDISVPPLDLSVRRAGDGPALALEDYGTDFTVESGGRAAKAALTLQVPSDGRYRITVAGGPDARGETVVLGKPVTRRILRLILGIAAFISGLGLGTLVIAIVTGLSLRDRT